jgi:hypothetical protein
LIEIMQNQKAEPIRRLLADLVAFETVSDRTNLRAIAPICR